MSFADRVHAVNIACIAHLGERDLITYRRTGSPAFQLPGILFQPVHESLDATSPGTNEKLFIHVDDFTAAAPPGVDLPKNPDEITVRGANFTVLSPQQDECGGITITLRKIT